MRVLSTFVDGLKIVGTEGKTTRWARLNNDPTGTKMTFEVGTGQWNSIQDLNLQTPLVLT